MLYATCGSLKTFLVSRREVRYVLSLQHPLGKELYWLHSSTFHQNNQCSFTFQKKMQPSFTFQQVRETRLHLLRKRENILNLLKEHETRFILLMERETNFIILMKRETRLFWLKKEKFMVKMIPQYKSWLVEEFFLKKQHLKFLLLWFHQIAAAAEE